MTIDQFREIRQKAGGLVILLPKNIASLSAEEKEVRMIAKESYYSIPLACFKQLENNICSAYIQICEFSFPSNYTRLTELTISTAFAPTPGVMVCLTEL